MDILSAICGYIIISAIFIISLGMFALCFTILSSGIPHPIYEKITQNTVTHIILSGLLGSLGGFFLAIATSLVEFAIAVLQK